MIRRLLAAAAFLAVPSLVVAQRTLPPAAFGPVTTPQMIVTGNDSRGPVDGMSVKGQTLGGWFSNLVFGTATITTLRDFPLAFIFPGSVIYTSGYYVAGDGGGGHFIYSSASSAADNGGTVVKPSSVSGSGRWVRVGPGPYSIRMFGARGDGSFNDTIPIRNAYLASTVAAPDRSTLTCPAGVYQLATQLIPAPGVTLVGERDCVLRPAPSSNGEIIDAGASDRVGFKGIKIDGNRAALTNPTATTHALIHLRNGTGSFVENVQFVNIRSIGAAGYGDHQRFNDNEFTNAGDRAIYFIGQGSNTALPAKNLEIKRNRIFGAVGHAINAANAEHVDISDNFAVGTVVGLRNTLSVNVSGNTITYNGGPRDFTDIMPGQFVVMNGGGEWHINGKQSNTVLTVDSNPGVPTNGGFPTPGNVQIAVVGSGDLYGLDSLQNGKFSNNTGMEAATFGMGIGNQGNFDSFNFEMNNNTFVNTGKLGMTVDGGQPGRTSYNITMNGNTLIDAGAGGDAVSNDDRSSIFMTKGQGSVRDIFIDNNDVISKPGSGQVLNWMWLDPAYTQGSITVGHGNKSSTLNGKRIVNDIKSIALYGWGSSATADSVASTGDQVSFRILAGGSGQGPRPSAVITKITDSGSDPVIRCAAWSTAGGYDNIYPLQTGGSFKGVWSLTYMVPTPVAATAVGAMVCNTH